MTSSTQRHGALLPSGLLGGELFTIPCIKEKIEKYFEK